MSTLNAFDVIVDPLQQAKQELDDIFREHYRLTYRTAYGVTGSAEDAEDVVQTIFLRLVRREFPPDLQKNPGAYLYRAAVNASLNTIRGRQRRVRAENDPARLDMESPPHPDSDEEIHRRLYAAVAELSPESAQILLLRYLHDYSDAEIANLLGTSRGTIAVSLYRSRSRLKKLMRGKS
jgi:RNA polymerase sigma-70 factor (ECF subfamily)